MGNNVSDTLEPGEEEEEEELYLRSEGRAVFTGFAFWPGKIICLR